MAGGVMTCQITGTPILKNAMAIIVRQSVYSWDKWMPISIPSYGLGNDDFMALDPMKVSRVQNDFAVRHKYSGMDEMLEEAFVHNASITHVYPDKNDGFRKLPFGIVYINDNIWKTLREDVLKTINREQWDNFNPDVESWVKHFIETIEERKKLDKLFSDHSHGHPLRKNELDDTMEGWYFYRDWYEDASIFMESWGEHRKLWSMEAYFPLAKQRALNNDVEWLTEFFTGVRELIYIQKALMMLRKDWFPQPSPQEYLIHKLQDKVAQATRRAYRDEADSRKEYGY